MLNQVVWVEGGSRSKATLPSKGERLLKVEAIEREERNAGSYRKRGKKSG